jgi:hypothetical protein
MPLAPLTGLVSVLQGPQRDAVPDSSPIKGPTRKTHPQGGGFLTCHRQPLSTVTA